MIEVHIIKKIDIKIFVDTVNGSIAIKNFAMLWTLLLSHATIQSSDQYPLDTTLASRKLNLKIKFFIDISLLLRDKNCIQVLLLFQKKCYVFVYKLPLFYYSYNRCSQLCTSQKKIDLGHHLSVTSTYFPLPNSRSNQLTLRDKSTPAGAYFDVFQQSRHNDYLNMMALVLITELI